MTVDQLRNVVATLHLCEFALNCAIDSRNFSRSDFALRRLTGRIRFDVLQLKQIIVAEELPHPLPPLKPDFED